MFRLLCAAIILTAITAVTKAQNSYKGTISEYGPYTNLGKREIILKNIENFVAVYATQSREQGAKIVVFPEYGLTGLTDDPVGFAIPIPEPNTNIQIADDIIVRLSSIAVEQQQYLVVNLLEESVNTTTKFYYNTNIVFNKTGGLIAKYRKINLYNEPKLTAGNEVVTFKTDYGVTYGLITCFDILFKKPARDIFNNPEVTDVVFPTAWVSTMPFWVSTSVHSGYAQANGINLLTSNYNKPSIGNGGSAVYFKDGTSGKIIISGEIGNQAIQEVVESSGSRYTHGCGTPKNTPNGPSLRGGLFPDRANISSYKTTKDFDVSKYQFKKVDISNNTFKDEICNNDFCCSFKFTISSPGVNDFYKIVAYNGRNSALHNEALQICALIACSSENNQDCGERLEPTTVFERIEIETTFKSEHDDYLQPTTLNSQMLPISSSFCNATSGPNQIVRLVNKSPESQLLTYGLMGQISQVSGAVTLYQMNIVFVLFMILVKNFV